MVIESVEGEKRCVGGIGEGKGGGAISENGKTD